MQATIPSLDAGQRRMLVASTSGRAQHARMRPQQRVAAYYKHTRCRAGNFGADREQPLEFVEV